MIGICDLSQRQTFNSHNWNASISNSNASISKSNASISNSTASFSNSEEGGKQIAVQIFRPVAPSGSEFLCKLRHEFGGDELGNELGSELGSEKGSEIGRENRR